MGWVLKNKPITQRASKTMAKEFAEMDKVQHERPLSERRLQVYERLFRAGMFRPVTWAKAFCQETKGWYRVNGQHTSNLLSEWKDKLPEFYVTIEEYECDTLEDVAKLYSTFDSKMQSRNANDINNSFASTVPELAGMTYHLWGADSYSKQPAERAELLLEHPEFVIWLDTILGSGGPGANMREEDRGGSKHIHRAPVIGAMFGTWQKAKGAATEFWTKVRDETDSSPGMPTRKRESVELATSPERSMPPFNGYFRRILPAPVAASASL